MGSAGLPLSSPLPKADITVGSQLFPDKPSFFLTQMLQATTTNKSELAHTMNPHICQASHWPNNLVLAKRMVPYVTSTWFPSQVMGLPQQLFLIVWLTKSPFLKVSSTLDGQKWNIKVLPNWRPDPRPVISLQSIVVICQADSNYCSLSRT